MEATVSGIENARQASPPQMEISKKSDDHGLGAAANKIVVSEDQA